MSFLWNQYPDLSAAPKALIKHRILEGEESVFECAVFLLENDKFLFIRFSSDDKNDKEVGITEVGEFDNLNDAAILFDTYEEG